MEAVKIVDLFKGNQLEEIKYWLDNESPFVDPDNWNINVNHYEKKCSELDTLHISTTDRVREIFAVHNLLPTFSRIMWYDKSPEGEQHIDTGATEFTVLYNYYSEDPVIFYYDGVEIQLENEEAIAYCGTNRIHNRNESDGISICLGFNYAVPSNPHFVLAEYNGNRFQYKSNRDKVDVDWLL